MTPAIVIPAYNRPASLRRLLGSLSAASFPVSDVPLVIAIDGEGEQEEAVRQIAEQFECNFGTKRIHYHERNVGLIDNVFFCAGLAEEYGAVVLLEDDLFVSPHFYSFAQQALALAAGDDRIAGIALNALWFNGMTHERFEPLHDGRDNFYLQVAWYQGQVYSADMWQKFKEWLGKEPLTLALSPGRGNKNALTKLHKIFDSFAENEWFPMAMRYLAETGRYYLFPRVSLATNFGDAGTHFAQTSHFFQTPLLESAATYSLASLDKSQAVYDSFFEPTATLLAPHLPELAGQPFDVDLRGLKTAAQMQHEYVVTTRPTNHVLRSWGLAMRPPEANLLHNVLGHEIVLSRVTDLRWDRRAEVALRCLWRRYAERPQIGLRRRLVEWIEEKIWR